MYTVSPNLFLARETCIPNSLLTMSTWMSNRCLKPNLTQTGCLPSWCFTNVPRKSASPTFFSFPWTFSALLYSWSDPELFFLFHTLYLIHQQNWWFCSLKYIQSSSISSRHHYRSSGFITATPGSLNSLLNTSLPSCLPTASVAAFTAHFLQRLTLVNSHSDDVLCCLLLMVSHSE